MSSKFFYALTGLIVSSVVAIMINLLSAAIQKQAFSDQFTTSSILFLVGLALIGTLIGAWLGEKVSVPTTPAHSTSQPLSHAKNSTITITRLKAFLSYGKLRGRGIHLRDIILIGSHIDIDA